MILIGRLRYLHAKRWGFIDRDDGQGSVFVPAYQFELAGIEPQRGDVFEFDMQRSPRDGRWEAAQLKLLKKEQAA
jgi:cold shock CspA family protein